MNIVLEDKLVSILDLYSRENKLGSKLVEIKNKISNNREDIVPVLGMQGMGKSTLINSILAENILPNEADETTCVPVEVKYGEEKKAEVYFANSDKIEIVYTIEQLREYVDNNYNNGNEKNVEKIVLFRPLEILKNGLVIVDLPGVGSLTKNNENTTKKYIENLSCALFVIPTVPTIRKHEEAFIRPIWELFANVIFVQNDWGESKREIEESIDIYNSKIKTENEVLDIILTDYNLRSINNSIELTCMADGKLLNFMEETDLYSLFGNMLSNAFEYELKVSLDKRFISLTITQKGKYVSIHCENYYDGGELKKNDGKVISSKKDSFGHGFGMISMQRIVAKYSGEFQYIVSDNMFQIDIEIPIGEHYE